MVGHKFVAYDGNENIFCLTGGHKHRSPYFQVSPAVRELFLVDPISIGKVVVFKKQKCGYNKYDDEQQYNYSNSKYY